MDRRSENPPSADAAAPRGFRPLFLVGAERSGTTVLRLMLDHHPQIAFAAEFDFAVDRVADDGSLPDAADLRESLAQDRMFLDAGFAIDASLESVALLESCLRQHQGAKDQIGATVHRHFDRLNLLWPDARFIHLLRDPRDVARSTLPMGWAGNVWAGARRWIEAEHCWDRVCASVPAQRRHELRFEDLMHAPEQELEKLCRFAGTRFDPAMLGYSEHSRYGPPNPALCQRWLQELPERDVRLIEARVGALLNARGYESSGLAPIEVAGWLRARLRIQDWLVRVRFRIRRFGFALFVADVVLRRLGLERWHRPVKRRMDAVISQTLR